MLGDYYVNSIHSLSSSWYLIKKQADTKICYCAVIVNDWSLHDSIKIC